MINNNIQLIITLSSSTKDGNDQATVVPKNTFSASISRTEWSAATWRSAYQNIRRIAWWFYENFSLFYHIWCVNFSFYYEYVTNLTLTYLLLLLRKIMLLSHVFLSTMSDHDMSKCSVVNFSGISRNQDGNNFQKLHKYSFYSRTGKIFKLSFVWYYYNCQTFFRYSQDI